MSKWEYTTLQYPDLNTLGADGWELVVVIQRSLPWSYIFKRPKL